MEHIRELRNRLLKALLGLGLGMVVGWIFFKPAWNFIAEPFCKLDIQGTVGCGKDGHPLIVTGVFDAFFLHLKIAFVVGLILSSPVWLYQLWAFIVPGLYAREKRWTYAFVGTAVPLFAIGGLFAYFALGHGLHFLLGLTPTGVKPLITTDTYLGYAMAMLLIFGLAFELPLIMVILNLAGVLTHARMRKWRRVMIFARVRVRRGGHPEPRSVLDAPARGALRDPGRAGRGLRVGQRPPPRPPAVDVRGPGRRRDLAARLRRQRQLHHG